MATREGTVRGAVFVGKALAVVVVWCLMMALYLIVYDTVEKSAAPVMLPTREFSAEQWDSGYFHAKGSYRNDTAKSAGDDIIPGTTDFECWQSSATCTVSVATVYNGFLNIDVMTFDSVKWDQRQITFGDEMAICMTNAYVIDRASESVTLITRKKAVIPEYALKSPLHPCDGLSDKNVTLGDGLQIYQQQQANFAKENGWKFHIALVLTHIFLLLFVVLLFRKRSIGADRADRSL